MCDPMPGGAACCGCGDPAVAVALDAAGLLTGGGGTRAPSPSLVYPHYHPQKTKRLILLPPAKNKKPISSINSICKPQQKTS